MANTIEQVQQGRDAVAMFTKMLSDIDAKFACAAADTDWGDRDVLIVDECSHSTAPQWKAQIESCKGARWGFSATPDGEDEIRNAELRLLFGCEEYVISRDKVADKLAPARVIMLDDTDSGLRAKIDAEIQDRIKTSIRRYGRWMESQNKNEVIRRILNEHNIPINGNFDALLNGAGLRDEYNAAMDEVIRSILWQRTAWQVCVEFGIIGNQARNNAVIRCAIKHKEDYVLVLINQIEHGKEIASRIPGALMCFSKMGAKKRKAALDAFRNGDAKCIVATSLADEGLDLPMASVLVLVSGGRSKARTEQRTGRVLRQFAGKKNGTIYDWVDNQHPLMAKHARQRVDVYKKLGYSVKVPESTALSVQICYAKTSI
jgi:superfamily II DNA or RNA helicase